MNPRYPVYIISKGRSESRLTSKALDVMNVPYRIVIEPQELDQYSAVIDPSRILVLPFSNLGQGSIPARNWVWQHAVDNGAARHWILDDNISCFYRWNHNRQIRAGDGTIFRCAEDFTDRYTNVAISGFEYFMFIPRKRKLGPYRLNTRIYSCILLNNSIPFRWRGRYNEDTDLSLQALKAGWCTILFQAFLAHKMATMTMKGGNTEALYKIKESGKDGRYLMAEALQQAHPDVTTITRKWNRWQHHVDYRQFGYNKLIRQPGLVVPSGINNYGMVLKEIEPITKVKLKYEPAPAVEKQIPSIAPEIPGDELPFGIPRFRMD